MAMPWLMGLAEVRETVTLWVSAATLLATAMLNARPNGNKDFFMGLSIKSGECPILFFCVNKSLRHFAAGTRAYSMLRSQLYAEDGCGGSCDCLLAFPATTPCSRLPDMWLASNGLVDDILVVFRLDQGTVQRFDGAVIVVFLDYDLHFNLADGLLQGLHADVGIGQCGGNLGQNALDLHIGADGGNDGYVMHCDFGLLVPLFDQAGSTVDDLARARAKVGDAVGIARLVDHINTQLLDDAGDLGVVVGIAKHFLVEYFDAENIFAAGNDFYPGCFTGITLANQGAGMLWLEGVLDAQLDSGTAQGAAGAGVDCFHAQVGQLVGHVIVGHADRDHFVLAYQVGVGGAQVELFVNDGFFGAGGCSDLGKGDLGVATVEGVHQAFAAVSVPRSDNQFAGKVDILEVLGDGVFETQWCLALLPAGKIGKAGIDATQLEGQYGIEGTVRFAQGGQHFAHFHQVLGQLEVSVMAQLLQTAHNVDAIINAAVDELSGLLQGMAVIAEYLFVLGQHGLTHGLQCLLPGLITAGFGKTLVHAGLTGFFVLQQLVGHAAVRGYDKNSLIDPVLGMLGQKNIVQYFGKAAHRGTADFFYAMHGV